MSAIYWLFAFAPGVHACFPFGPMPEGLALERAHVSDVEAWLVEFRGASIVVRARSSGA